MKSAVIAVLIDHRTQEAPNFQKVITERGCLIKTRLGVHRAGDTCSEDGLVILHLAGSKQEITDLEQAINQIEDVRAKVLYLDF